MFIDSDITGLAVWRYVSNVRAVFIELVPAPPRDILLQLLPCLFEVANSFVELSAVTPPPPALNTTLMTVLRLDDK